MLASSTTLNLEIEYIKNRLNNQDKNMEIVFQYLDVLLKKKDDPQLERNRIGYKIGAGTKDISSEN